VVSVGTLKEGDVFGKMGLISQSVRSANISAIGDVTVGVIDKEIFEGVMNNLPEDLKPIILSLVERLKITTQLLTRIGLELETTRNKINSYALKEKE
jgi:CRP-like cAMP-binding protein